MPALTTSHTRPASPPVVAARPPDRPARQSVAAALPASSSRPAHQPDPASSSRLSRHASPARQLRHGHTYPHLTHRVIHNVSRIVIHNPRF